MAHKVQRRLHIIPTAHLSPMLDSTQEPENLSASSFFPAFLDSLAPHKTLKWASALLRKLPLLARRGSGVCQPICHCSFSDNTCAPHSTQAHRTEVEGARRTPLVRNAETTTRNRRLTVTVQSVCGTVCAAVVPHRQGMWKPVTCITN